MIYTVTLNPSLDYMMQIDTIKLGETNRSCQEEIYPGGKGFNVTMMLKNLNMESMALGVVGGFTGSEIERLLKQKDILCELYPLKTGMSRINVKLKATTETEVNGAGPFISDDDLLDLKYKISKLEDGDMLILAGSVPASLGTMIYKELMQLTQGKTIKVVVDATKDLLKNTLSLHPFLIKPNLAELEELCACHIHNLNDLLDSVSQLQSLGATNVLVSMGKDGAILVDEAKQIYYCQAAKGELKNSVGSGDSMIAGFITGYLKSQNLEEALKLGSACGSATAFSADIATCDKVAEIYTQLQVKRL